MNYRKHLALQRRARADLELSLLGRDLPDWHKRHPRQSKLRLHEQSVPIERISVGRDLRRSTLLIRLQLQRERSLVAL